MPTIPGILAKGAALASLLLALQACSANKGTDTGGKTDNPDTGKPTKGLIGILLDSKGSPLKGAVVKAIPATQEALAKASARARVESDSALTDSAGTFILTGLAQGVYNIFGYYGKGDLVILIQGVAYGGESSLLELKPDTLRAPARISGRIQFDAGDSGGIVITIPGTPFRAVTGDSGSFTLSGIPPGTYAMNCRLDGFKTLVDSGISVKAGETLKAPALQLEADPAFPPPTPLGLTVAYDTLTGKATLRWRKVKVDDLAGYVLYRDAPSASAPTRLGSSLIMDTAYVDALFPDAADSTDKEYAYRVKSQDAGSTVSAAFSAPVTVKAVAPSKLRTRFTWKLSGTKGDSASIGDSVTVSAAWANGARRIVKLEFYVDAKSSPVRAKKDSAQTGVDSVKVTSATAAVRTVFAAATDDGGAVWWDSLTVRFVIDAPRVDAGKDTAVGIHTRVDFAGSATRTFGTIALFKWDFNGDGVYDDSSATGSASHTYDHSGNFIAKLLARDDDGNEAFDTRTIQVTNQPPVVNSVRADTTVSINDPVRFAGTGSDPDGTVKAYGWDFDGDGTLDSSSASPFAPVHRYPAVGVYNAMFQVTDDDGDIATRTVKVTVVKDPPTANAGKDTTVSIKDTVRLHGSGTDKFGSIVAWAWSCGGTGFFPVSSGDTSVIAPAVANASWLCVLRVMDDDSNFALDTMKVTVVKDAPTANAGNDTTVSISDAVNLKGRGTDVYGTVVERAWDIGATGTFRPVSSGDTTITASATPGSMTCILRVTDDDGNATKDTMVVTVVLDAPVANAGHDTTVAVGQSLTLTGKATQQFGTIAMYKWDWQDNGSWDDSSSTSASTTFPVTQGGTRTVLFEVRDDDGNTAVDTLLVHAVSYVGGTLASNTTFLKTLSPYVLTSDLIVPSGVNLIISAGVDLSGPYTLLVKGGTLTAVGIAADSVFISSPVRFEGSDLSGSELGYAHMSAATALQLGNNALGSGPAQNSGTLVAQDISFPKNKVVVEAMSGNSKLLLRRVDLDSATVLGNGTGAPVDIRSSTLSNATVQSGDNNQGIVLDSITASNSSFLLGDNGAAFTVRNSSLSASKFAEAGGQSPLGSGASPEGPVSFANNTLDNTTVELPKSTVHFDTTSITFSTVTPLIKIGHGTLFKAKFTGAGSGNGLEITGYDGNAIGGATTLDSCQFQTFGIGLLVRNFGTLAISNTNFVNNASYDLSNQAAGGFDALDCYWSGAASDVNVNTRIRDFSDDAAFGAVNFTPYITTAITF